MSNQKTGLDYFPLSVDIDSDDKIALIQAKYGIEGFTTIIKMFIKIYSDKGYYYEWTEEKQLLFSSKIGISFERVNEIINDAVKWKIFDKDIFEKYQILTSKRIQEIYLEATKRRKKVEILKAYLLLNGNNANISNQNVYIIKENAGILKQSKVKKSKVKKSKIYGPNSYELRLSQFLLSKIKKRNPDHKEPDLQKWAHDVDLMIRIDKREPLIIEKLIIWCQQDSFWQNNILSTAKLRAQYDQLLLKMNSIKDKTEVKPEPDLIKLTGKARHCFTTEHSGYCENPHYTGSGVMLKMCEICKDMKGKW